MADITGFMPLDILFYKALPGDIYDSAITEVTQSPYVHVAIAVSAVQKIEALSRGIVKTPIDGRAVAAHWSYTQQIKDIDANRLADALNWLESMRGTVYGWGDAANALIQRAGFNLAIIIGDHLDCSGLATETLMKAGGVPGLQTITDPHVVTPALLAGYLGIV